MLQPEKSEKWYEQQPEPITEAKELIILRDFVINTERKIKGNRPNISVKDYKRKDMPSN